jgi:adenylate cyclase
MKKILLNPWWSLLTLVAIVLVRIWDPSFVESVRLRYFDQLVTSRPTTEIPVNVVNVDEAALDKYGQWPFSRDVYADIIKELYARNAGLVVFNVLMPEADRFKQDAVLSKTMQEYPVVLPTLGNNKQKNTSVIAPATVIGADPKGLVAEYPGLIANVPELEQAAVGVGVVNTFPEIDGVVRRTPLVIYSQEHLRPSLALEVLRVAAGDAAFQIKLDENGVNALRIPQFGKITTDNISRVWIDWSQRPKSYSLANLPKDFNKQIVIVGASAAGIANPVATSRGEIWPQDLQASVIGTMLAGSTIQRPAYADALELGVLITAGIILIVLARWLYVGIVATVIFAVGGVLGSMYVYQHYLFLFDATTFTAGIILIALHAYMVKFLDEFFQKQMIRKQFQSYLSPDLVAKLIKDPSLLRLGGEEKELSIMFTDVRGFTAISEHYGKNVQGLTSIMNRYMTAMTKRILENDGTLDKYIGDAQMAFWNAPLDESKHCKDAVKSALDMLGDLEKFNKEVELEGVPPFGMGIGINTGVVVVGNMGSEQRFDYTCLGDAVNLASRLEGQSKNYGVLIVLGPVTADRVKDEYQVIELDCIAVKGKTQGVNIFTVLGPIGCVSQEDVDLHNQMLSYYRATDFNTAIILCNSLKGKLNGLMDQYYDMWMQRCEDMKWTTLSEDWDGVYRATSK